MSRSRALVFGGSGAVGAEVVRALAKRSIPTVFTFFSSSERATTVNNETGQRAVKIDLADGAAVRAFIETLDHEGLAPDIFIHCAAAFRDAPIAELTDEDWDRANAINARSAFIAARALGPIMKRQGGGDIVLVGALDRTQSLPLPVHFAASQGALAALTISLAKELGRDDTRVNMLAVGLLESGLSRSLAPALADDYARFSALRRRGTPQEIARVICWLALESRYLTGKVIPVNGGI